MEYYFRLRFLYANSFGAVLFPFDAIHHIHWVESLNRISIWSLRATILIYFAYSNKDTIMYIMYSKWANSARSRIPPRYRKF